MVFECVICEKLLETPSSPGILPVLVHYENECSNQNPAEDLLAIVVTQCGHMFHEVCIVKWFKDKTVLSCPSCRVICDPSTDSLKRVFPTIAETDPATAKTKIEEWEMENAKQIHVKLITDYEELQQMHFKALDDLEMANTAIMSYDEMIQNQGTTIVALEEGIKQLTAELLIQQVSNGDRASLCADPIIDVERSFERPKRKFSRNLLGEQNGNESFGFGARKYPRKTNVNNELPDEEDAIFEDAIDLDGVTNTCQEEIEKLYSGFMDALDDQVKRVEIVGNAFAEIVDKNMTKVDDAIDALGDSAKIFDLDGVVKVIEDGVKTIVDVTCQGFDDAAKALFDDTSDTIAPTI